MHVCVWVMNHLRLRSHGWNLHGIRAAFVEIRWHTRAHTQICIYIYIALKVQRHTKLTYPVYTPFNAYIYAIYIIVYIYMLYIYTHSIWDYSSFPAGPARPVSLGCRGLELRRAERGRAAPKCAETRAFGGQRRVALMSIGEIGLSLW